MKLGEKVGNILLSVSMYISSIIVGFTVSWKLSLVLFSLSPLLLVGGWFTTKKLQEGSQKNREAFEEAGGIAEEVLYQIKTVASFSNFKYELDRFDVKLEESYKQGVRNGLKTGLGVGFFFFVIFCSYSLAIWYGSTLIGKDYNDNTKELFKAGDILTVLFTIIFGSMSLGQSSPNFTAITEACVAATPFFELRKRVPMIDISKSNLKPSKEELNGHIIFRNVDFVYPSKKEREIFSNLNFEILPGSKTAIVGESGSGKSTIVSLIERLYDVVNGEIMINNYNLKDLDLEYFRSLIGYVPQEPVLFNTTIRENIIFGRENVTEQEIVEACTKAQADEFINNKAIGLDYVVGIKGSKLSGGQKQRVAIARAILKKPILLILDEATSALDNETEKEVQHALDSVSADVTTIIISHRLSTILNSNFIIFLKNGKIIEAGNHQNLYDLKGEYYTMIKHQITDIPLKKDNRIQQVIEEIQNVRMETAADVQDKVLEQHQHQESKQLIDKKYVSKSKRRLLPILMEDKASVILGALFAASAGCSWPVYGILLAESIATLSNQLNPNLVDDGFLLSMYFLALAGGAGISYLLENYFFSRIGEYLTKRLRYMTFEKYLRFHMGYFDILENTPGQLLTRLSSDTNKLNGIALSMVGVSVQTISTVIIGVTLGLVYDWRIGLINLGFFPFVLVTAGLRWTLHKGFASQDEHLENMAGNVISESVTNTKTLFAYNMQNKVVDMYVKILRGKDKQIFKRSLMIGALFGLSQFMIFGTYATLFYAGGNFMAQGTLEMKNMLKSIFCIFFAAFGIGHAQQYIGDLSEANKALVNLFKLFDEPSLIDPFEKKQIVPKEIIGRIEFRDVFFSYPTRPNQIILNGLNFTIEPGQRAAFVGYSGSGKSTIIQLLERFYDVQGGEVLIDNINIKDYDLISLRKLISLVMQEPVLFKKDVIENIKYGKLDATPEEIRIAATEAKIEKFIAPEYDKNVLPVSGGEKQRIAIARSIIKQPRILLLDEATSALDKLVEEDIQKSLENIMRNKTSIVVAHR